MLISTSTGSVRDRIASFERSAKNVTSDAVRFEISKVRASGLAPTPSTTQARLSAVFGFSQLKVDGRVSEAEGEEAEKSTVELTATSPCGCGNSSCATTTNNNNNNNNNNGEHLGRETAVDNTRSLPEEQSTDRQGPRADEASAVFVGGKSASASVVATNEEIELEFEPEPLLLQLPYSLCSQTTACSHIETGDLGSGGNNANVCVEEKGCRLHDNGGRCGGGGGDFSNDRRKDGTSGCHCDCVTKILENAFRLRDNPSRVNWKTPMSTTIQKRRSERKEAGKGGGKRSFLAQKEERSAAQSKHTTESLNNEVTRLLSVVRGLENAMSELREQVVSLEEKEAGTDATVTTVLRETQQTLTTRMEALEAQTLSSKGALLEEGVRSFQNKLDFLAGSVKLLEESRAHDDAKLKNLVSMEDEKRELRIQLSDLAAQQLKLSEQLHSFEAANGGLKRLVEDLAAGLLEVKTEMKALRQSEQSLCTRVSQMASDPAVDPIKEWVNSHRSAVKTREAAAPFMTRKVPFLERSDQDDRSSSHNDRAEVHSELGEMNSCNHEDPENTRDHHAEDDREHSGDTNLIHHHKDALGLGYSRQQSAATIGASQELTERRKAEMGPLVETYASMATAGPPGDDETLHVENRSSTLSSASESSPLTSCHKETPSIATTASLVVARVGDARARRSVSSSAVKAPLSEESSVSKKGCGPVSSKSASTSVNKDFSAVEGQKGRRRSFPLPLSSILGDDLADNEGEDDDVAVDAADRGAHASLPRFSKSSSSTVWVRTGGGYEPLERKQHSTLSRWTGQVFQRGNGESCQKALTISATAPQSKQTVGSPTTSAFISADGGKSVDRLSSCGSSELKAPLTWTPSSSSLGLQPPRKGNEDPRSFSVADSNKLGKMRKGKVEGGGSGGTNAPPGAASFGRVHGGKAQSRGASWSSSKVRLSLPSDSGSFGRQFLQQRLSANEKTPAPRRHSVPEGLPGAVSGVGGAPASSSTSVPRYAVFSTSMLGLTECLKFRHLATISEKGKKSQQQQPQVLSTSLSST